MYIKDFQIENFKTLSSVKINFHPKRNFILGNNGFGKTSLLEAIYTLITSYSFSRQTDKDLINKEQIYYNLNGNVVQQNIQYNLFLRYEQKASKKQYLLDGKKVPQYKILLEKFPISFFTPFDIQNILGEPQYRRLFFDRMISYLNPHYYRYLKEYQKVLKEKNYLLKQQDYQLLELWNERMLDLAYKIIQERLKYISRFNQLHIDKEFLYPAFLDNLFFQYKGAHTLEELIHLMESKFMDEKKRQTSLWGPHRDDIILLSGSNNKPIKQHFSLGQVKWTSFYLKLLEITLMNKELETSPPFLIDDVFSELDSENQKLLLKVLEILPNQIFSTSTNHNLDIFKNNKESIFFFEKKGELICKS